MYKCETIKSTKSTWLIDLIFSHWQVGKIEPDIELALKGQDMPLIWMNKWVTRSDLATLLCYYYCLIFFSLQSNLNESKGCRCSNWSHKVRGAVSVTVEKLSSRWYKFWYKYWYINTDINTDNKYWYKFPDDTFNFEAYQYK